MRTRKVEIGWQMDRFEQGATLCRLCGCCRAAKLKIRVLHDIRLGE